MRALWLPPGGIGKSAWEALVAGAEAGGWTPHDVALKLLSGSWLAFETSGGVLAVEKRDTRLVVTSFAVSDFGKRGRGYAGLLRRLAADMQCDTVETTAFSSRLASAITKMGAEVESWTLVMRADRDGQ